MRSPGLAVLLIVGIGSITWGQDERPQGSRPTLLDSDFSLDLPTPEQLYRVDSESQALDRMRATHGRPVAFPLLPKLIPHALVPEDHYPPQQICTIPGVVCHRPVYFEDGREFLPLDHTSFFEPIRSAFQFYGRVITLPARMIHTPPWTVECHGP